MFRRPSTGAVVDPQWLQFSFPPRWSYDVLRGLDYLRDASVEPNGRLAEAIDPGRPGALYFDLDEGEGRPSRWNTLRALRVLAWHERGARKPG